MIARGKGVTEHGPALVSFHSTKACSLVHRLNLQSSGQPSWSALKVSARGDRFKTVQVGVILSLSYSNS